MMIDVYLTDHRTVIRFASREAFVRLVKREPDTLDEERAQRVWLDRAQGEGFIPARVQYVRRSVVGWVEQVPIDIRDAFLADHDPDFLARIREKEAQRAAAEVTA